MGDVTLQSNAGGVSGQGLNPTLTVTNAGDHDFKIIQQHTRLSYFGFQFTTPDDTEVALNRVWRPFDDLAKEDRFLIPHIQATTMFNYYRLMEVEYTFLISVASYNTGWDAGPAVFRLLPWTGDFGSGTTTNYIQHCPLSPIVNTTGCTSERINPLQIGMSTQSPCRDRQKLQLSLNINEGQFIVF